MRKLSDFTARQRQEKDLRMQSSTDARPPATLSDDTAAAILLNDLDTALLRIEELGAHPLLTDAGTAVQEARKALADWRGVQHAERMKGHTYPG